MASPIRRLVSGFKSFRAEYYDQRPEHMRDLLAHGQHPRVLVIACSDSRVDPALITKAEPGELFVIRNVANIVPPCEKDGRHHSTSAALQFAVTGLEVSDIVVLGHSSCGGIRALASQASGNDEKSAFLSPWIALATRPCADLLDAGSDGGVDFTACEQAAIKGSLSNLRTYPFVRERIDDGTLTIHGWWFDIGTGRLWTFDATKDAFRQLA